jgi:CDP-diacylglycerol---glycerol-3-phosphate 3-phosphatidyltransferase
MVFRNNAPLAEHYARLLHAISHVSHELQDGERICNTNLPMTSRHYARRARSLLHAFAVPSAARATEQQQDTSTNWVAPTLQFAYAGIRHDQAITNQTIETLCSDERSSLCIASPYFNITDQYRNTLLTNNKAASTIITASPRANGFFGSSGPSRFIPAAYAHMEHQFIEAARKAGQASRIAVREYARPDWSFHAKGLWWQASADAKVSVTMIGSSNFGMMHACMHVCSRVSSVRDSAVIASILLLLLLLLLIL